MIQNNINLYSRIKQTTDHRSIISKNRVFAYFGILAFFRNKIWITKKPEKTKKDKNKWVVLMK